MTRALLMLALLLVAVGPWRRQAGALAAQTDSRLVEALRLAQSGQVDSGRAIVRRLLATLSPGDSVYPQALLAAAKMARDGQTVASNLNRIVVEYGAGPWADDALLLLTQLYFAQHDAAQTVQAGERLNRDYPGSPLRPRASFYTARAYFELKNETRGCELIRQAMDGTGDDVEFKNQVSFYAARCSPSARITATGGGGAGGVGAGAGGGTTTDTAKPNPAAPRAYAVQVLAVKSASQVDEMLTRLKAMGFDARVLRDDSTGFFKVRVGRYATREEAQRAQQRLRQKMGGQPFVVDEP
ncbi:MAG TPA: SPOR domain-containing protein [Gemmatimonadales bacterium]|nr:SPOR domain-containing protein [Gemmatimonadales bacterium]